MISVYCAHYVLWYAVCYFETEKLSGAGSSTQLWPDAGGGHSGSVWVWAGVAAGLNWVNITMIIFNFTEMLSWSCLSGPGPPDRETGRRDVCSQIVWYCSPQPAARTSPQPIRRPENSIHSAHWENGLTGVVIFLRKNILSKNLLIFNFIQNSFFGYLWSINLGILFSFINIWSCILWRHNSPE